MPVGGDNGLMHEKTHTAHSIWITKIQKLWRRLNRRRNQEVVRIQNEIKKNKRYIGDTMRENLFELDVNFNDQQILLNWTREKNSVNKHLKSNGDQKKVLELQSKIRDEIARKQEFDTWGFNNYIIEYRLKVRMTEDVIDCAQRLLVKNDAKTQRELDLLTALRDRTYEDLVHFVNEREKKPWRIWDKYGYYFKPPVENRGLNLAQT